MANSQSANFLILLKMPTMMMLLGHRNRLLKLRGREAVAPIIHRRKQHQSQNRTIYLNGLSNNDDRSFRTTTMRSQLWHNRQGSSITRMLFCSQGQFTTNLAISPSTKGRVLFSTTPPITATTPPSVLPEPSWVDARHAPLDFEPSCAVVYRDFIMEHEADALAQVVLARMRRRRYERGHWDAVITDYKEVELDDASFEESDQDVVIPDVLQRIREHLGQHHLSHKHQTDSDTDGGGITWLPCHGIDLKIGGELNAHVDSIKFSGDLVAGLSLLTPSIMRLKPAPDVEIANQEKENDKHGNDNGEYTRSKVTSSPSSSSDEEGWVDIYLPPRSLYALTGVGRYGYTHELLPSGSTFMFQSSSPTNGDDINNDNQSEIVVERGHRLSVIFRDAK